MAPRTTAAGRRAADRSMVSPAGARPAVASAVRAGEILGVAGVDGNGQIELAETLAGLRPRERGSIPLDGRDISRAHRSRIACAPGSPICRRTAVNGARADHIDRRQPDAARQPPSALCARRFSCASASAATKARADARITTSARPGRKRWRRGFPAAISRRSWSRASSTGSPRR